MEEPKFETVLFRASSIGHLMTEPKGKTNLEKYTGCVEALSKLREDYANIKNKETITAAKKLDAIKKTEEEVQILDKIKDEVELSESAKTHLVDVFVRNKYGRQTDITNKFIEKGLMVEEDGITLYSRVSKNFYTKNEEHLKNDFIMGTPDIYKGSSIQKAEHIVDIKCSWDIFTFFRNKVKKINSLYYWQLQAYMALTGAKTSTLAYCLIDTPDCFINDEKRKLFYKMAIASEDNPVYMEACYHIEKSMLYGDIPIEEKIIEFQVERNEEDIKKMYSAVVRGREYLLELEDQIKALKVA